MASVVQPTEFDTESFTSTYDTAMNTRRLVERLVSVAATSLLAISLGCSVTKGDAIDDSSSSIASGVLSSSNSDNSVYAQTSTWLTQTSDSVRLADLTGRVQVVAMVYTNCHSTCPLIVADMKRIQASLTDAERDQVGFVLVSLDPARDTSERMAEWATSVGLDGKHWTLLSGDVNAVRETAALLSVRYQAQQNGELVHSNGLTILDRHGNIAHQQMALGESAISIASVKSLLY